MPAYVIVDVEVSDPVKYAAYREMAPPVIAAHGGRYLVRGGAMTVLEGDWSPERVVVLEFPTIEDAKAFYHSPEYGHAREVRAEGARLNMIAVLGV
jgi:uncharacterized protein (DUF1330 family)